MSGVSARLVGWSTATVLVLGIAAVATGVASHLMGAGASDEVAPAASSEAPAPPAVTTMATELPIAALADPAWVRRTAESTAIPERALAAYAGASLRLAAEQPACGIGWNTLAAIGQTASDHGRVDGAVLTADGRADPEIVGDPAVGDAALGPRLGPLQVVPSTWEAHQADGDLDGESDPQQIDDAVLATGRFLCQVGGDLSSPEGWVLAVSAFDAQSDYSTRIAELAQSWVVAAPT